MRISKFDFEETGTWYLMKSGFGMIDPCYVRAYVPSQALPFGSTFPVSFSELGVRSLVPREVDSNVFFENAIRQASAEEVELEEISRWVEWYERGQK